MKFPWKAASTLHISIIVCMTILIAFFGIAALAVTGIFLFVVAFTDYIPDGMTLWDCIRTPLFVFGSALLLILIALALCAHVYVRHAAKMAGIFFANRVLKTLTRRFELISGAYAEFREKNGRAPEPDDLFELPALGKRTKYSDLPLIILYPGDAAKDGARPEINGVRVVVAPIKPWTAPNGFNTIVLLENGEALPIFDNEETQRIHRVVDDVLERRRADAAANLAAPDAPDAPDVGDA